MLDLSPTKLIIIFIVVVVLLGPKRLPEVARQLGAGWRKVRELHLRFDRELRETMPDLPSSRDIVRFARSPVTLLDQLADRQDAHAPDGAAEVAPVDGGRGRTEQGAPPSPTRTPSPTPSPSRLTVPFGVAYPVIPSSDTDDPNLN